MSKQHVGAFLDAVAQDESLRKRWNEAAGTDELVVLAEEQGYNVEAGELDEAQKAVLSAHSGELGGELGDDELERVAGGWSWGETNAFVKMSPILNKVQSLQFAKIVWDL